MRSSLTKLQHLSVGLGVAIGVSVASILAVATVPQRAGSATVDATSPVSASFLASGEGWILSAYRCATGACIKVDKTTNDGRSWTSLPLPAHLRTAANRPVANYFPLVPEHIYFADAKNGWIYGSKQTNGSNSQNIGLANAEIWSTHDGGTTWSAVDVRARGMKYDVLSVAAGARSVYAIGWLTGQSFGLWRSSVTTDSWRRLRTPTLNAAAGGSNMEGALIFRGASGWLLVGNDRGATGSARLTGSSRWVTWTPPCNSVGDSLAIPAATSATTLVDVCTIGGFGGYVAPGTPHYLKLQSNWVFTSHDAGRTFVPTAQVVINGSSEFLDPLLSLPASPSPGSILVARWVSHGLYLSDHLYLTRDGGTTWKSVYATAPKLFGPTLQFVSFASSRLGYAIVQRTTASSALIISRDGGRTWHAAVT